RAIYTFMRRSAPYPSLVTFDAPSREFCTVRRVRTNTPLQALTTLNDPYFFEAARAMAKRMIAEGGTSDADRITYGFRLVVARKPAKDELDRVLAFHEQQLAHYRQDPVEAREVIADQKSAVENAPELAAWTMGANGLLNMDETISKEEMPMKRICMIPSDELLLAATRRHFFRQAGFGIGASALTGLLNESLFAEAGPSTVNPLAPKAPMFPAKAKSVIYLFMAGAPSQVDLLDFKPTLQKYDGQNVPQELMKGERFAFIKGTPKLLGSPYEFKRCGNSGLEISELLPHLQGVADEIAVVKSMHTTQFNHAPAQIFMNTGFQIIGRPSMGAWMTYGLGSECKDLPGFVVLISGENQPDGGKACWGSGFLPTLYQGVEFRSQGDPVLFLTNPEGVSAKSRRASL